MADVKAKVSQSRDTAIRATTENTFTVARRIDELVDVNTEILDDGSVLVYDNIREEWISTTLLNEQIIDAGEF